MDASQRPHRYPDVRYLLEADPGTVFLDPEKLKPGTAVRVRYGVLSEVFGNLVEVSKYDIVLDNMFGYSTAKDGEGAKLIGEKKLVIERASIHQLRRNRG